MPSLVFVHYIIVFRKAEKLWVKFSYRQGERTDPEAAGLSHIGAVAWNALILIWFDLRGFKPKGDKVRNDEEGFDDKAV
jgi:hypothetical protein